MGAYYQTQFVKNDKVKAFDTYFIKFLEFAYFNGDEAQTMYKYIRENSPVQMRTVCDYDDDGRWDGRGETVEPTKAKDFVFDGVYVCHNRKEYFDIREMTNLYKEKGFIIDDVRQENDKYLYAVSPIHLLTRKNRECMGGGDIDDRRVNSDCITTWYDETVHYQENTDGLDEYTNLSEQLVFAFDM